MRDITLGDTFYHDFPTRQFSDGVPTVLAGSPVLSVLEENNATPITAGVSLSVSRASVAGLNEATIVATGGNGYEAGKSYSIYISTGTVGGVSVIGEVVGQFTIEASAAAVDLANGTDGLGVLKTDTSAIIDLVNGLGGSTGGSVSIQTVLDNTLTDVSINNGGAAVDKSTSPPTVGIPVTGHAFVAGQQVTLANTASNDGSFDVDSVSVNEVVILKTFAAETFGPDDTISSTVKTIGFIGSVQAGTVTSTEALDGVIHDIDDVGNDIDLVYTFSVGAGRTGTEIIFHGFVQGNGDTLDIEVYDHVGTAWEILRTITGQNGTSNITLEVPLLLKHTGTSGLDTGRVYVRFDTNATTPSNLSIDQLLIEAINTGNLNAYENGQIWINTSASNTNTVADVDGTSRRPVSTIAAAKTLSTSTGLGDFHVINGSSITLAENTTNESYFGDNWTLALGGQDVDGAYFQGPHASGVGVSATEVHFEGAEIGTMSVQNGHFDFCSFNGTVTQTLAGDYNYHNCYSKVAGVGGPTFTKTAGQVVTVQFRNWSGSITLSGIEASDVITISGTELGDVVLNGADGTVKVLGIYESLTDSRTGAPTLIEGAFEGSDVTDILVDTGEIGTAGAGLTNINLPNQTMDIVGSITGNLSGSVGSVTGAVGSVTAQVSADITAISGDAPAADNLELDYNGTGYAKANSTIGTTTTNTDMRGTDGALTDKAGFSLSTAGILAIWHQALSAIVTASSIGKLLKDEITSVRMATLTDWINGGRLDLILDARMAEASINTTGGAVDTVTTVTTTTTNTDMRGTDNAALASVLGALADAAAAGDPTSADTIMQYLKQLVNTLEGTVGIPTYPAAADPANNVSLAEAIRAIRDDVTGLAGSVMRGTDDAALASVATEARLAELDAGNLPTDIATVQADLDIITGAAGAVLDSTATSAQLVDDVLDEVNTGVEHNVTNSLGKQIREASAVLVLETGTAQAGAAGSITLASGANSNNDFYGDTRIVIVGGTGIGQARLVHDYDGGTKIALTVPDWVVNPNNTSEYQVQSQSNVHVHELEVAALAQINAEVDTALSDYGGPTNAEMEARTLVAASYFDPTADIVASVTLVATTTTNTDVAALNDLSAAQVNAEVVDALNVDTYAEPGQGTPAATASIVDKLGYLFKQWRNKTDNDGVTVQLYNDDTTTVDQKRGVAETGGTVTKNEVITGP